MKEIVAELRAHVLRLVPAPGTQATALAGLTLLRWEETTLPIAQVYNPRVCLGIDGVKEITVGEQTTRCGPGDELVVSLAVPVTGRVASAPYIALTLDVDVLELAELAGSLPPAEDAGAALAAGPATPGLLDAALRAVRMLASPAELSVLGPLVRREMLFRMLMGPRGATLRTLVADRGHVTPISRVLAHLREHYAEPLDVERLARGAAMSVPTFNRHFRAITAMSPLQYLKQVRLQEARRLLVGEEIDVGSVSARVGYESPTHFTREYARFFGAPPRRDASRVRAGITGA